MIAKLRTLLLSGAFVLIAASAFIPLEASACSAVTAERNGVGVVDIVCSPGDAAVAPFRASGGGTEGGGIDTLTMSGGSIVANGVATPTVNGVSNLQPSVGVIDMLGGNDIVSISGGSIGTAAAPIGVVLGAGADTFNMSGGTISWSVFGLGGGNTYTVSGGTIAGSLYAGSQNDRVTISGTANIHGDTRIGPDSVGLEDGNDTFVMTGGTLAGAVSGGNGNDVLTISGGTIGGYVAGNAGVDRITISGGTIAGDVDAETVLLTGGTIGGDISGIGGTTLVINDFGSATPINLRNGILISGVNAVGFIANSDLAAGGTRTQVFSGFTSLSATNSTLGFGSGAIGIGALNMSNGSTLFVRGNTTMAGVATLSGSAINMINGAAGDVLTLGGLVLNNGLISVDVNQRTIAADRLTAGALTATGTNVINVNLLGAPVFTRQTDIPIIVTGGPVAGTFVAQGLPGTQASLFTYQVLAGPAGLFVRATPANFGFALATQNAVDVSAIDTALDALYGINRDALDIDLGLANGPQKAQIASTFAVFASGQLAHTEHDGFTISAGGLSGDGPSFGADDFSAAISLDFDAAKHFAFDQEYGLNLGLFAGYASTDVDLDPILGFDNVGDATNRAGMIGGYGLFRKEYNYALVSATAFLGETDIFNGVLNGSGSYGTEGYAVTGSVGHIFKLSDTLRFDLRGGLLAVSFRGDDYADSNGNQYGGSEISFGAVKFEPGIYMDRQLENGMIFSPYARADLQQRFGYTNTASLDTVEFDFDDADFSAALLTGFNLKVSKSTTVSGEVRGKLSADSQTIAGKLGLKFVF